MQHQIIEAVSHQVRRIIRSSIRHHAASTEPTEEEENKVPLGAVIPVANLPLVAYASVGSMHLRFESRERVS